MPWLPKRVSRMAVMAGIVLFLLVSIVFNYASPKPSTIDAHDDAIRKPLENLKVESPDDDAHHKLMEFTYNDDSTEEEIDEILRKLLHPSSYLYSGYKSFSQKFGLEQSLLTASLSQKCDAFFSELSHRSPDWLITEVHGFNNKIGEMLRTIRDIADKLKGEWRDSHNGSEDGYKFDLKQIEEANKRFQKTVRESLAKLHDLGDATTILRVFGKCFLNDRQDRDSKVYNDYSKRILKFFTGKFPKFSRAGVEHERNSFPLYDKSNAFVGDSKPYDGENYIEYARTTLSGRGIVISATTSFKKDLLGLINVLRATNNDLPIQIVHRGDLSEKVQNDIIQQAKMNVDDYIKKTLKDDKPDGKASQLIKLGRKYGATFPVQDVWFVDIKECISSDFTYTFRSYYNKLLAYFFNSFSEILFMDADAVLLVPPQKFFESAEYTRSGTYFFKDRTLKVQGQYIDAAAILHLSPVNKKSIDTLFGLPLLTEKVSSSRVVQGWYHYQEAGVVLMDRKRHFLGALMTLPLVVWNGVFGGVVYGDKELYWIGLALAGDEDYEFNPNAAAAAGNLYSDSKYNLKPEWDSVTVCSTHPAHINEEGKLLWLNSGLKFCKNNEWDKDKDKERFKGYNDDEVKQLFAEPVKLQGAVVPPDPPAIWSHGLPYSTLDYKSAKKLGSYFASDRNKQHLLPGRKKVDGPALGWMSTGACDNYDYCAFEKVLSFHKDRIFDRGRFYKFTAQDTEHYDYYARIWMLAQ